jgi:hypothetical protein
MMSRLIIDLKHKVFEGFFHGITKGYSFSAAVDLLPFRAMKKRRQCAAE